MKSWHYIDLAVALSINNKLFDSIWDIVPFLARFIYMALVNLATEVGVPVALVTTMLPPIDYFIT